MRARGPFAETWHHAIERTRGILGHVLTLQCPWEQTRGLLLRMLEPDPAQRATASELLESMRVAAAAGAAAAAARAAVSAASDVTALAEGAAAAARGAGEAKDDARAERARKRARR